MAYFKCACEGSGTPGTPGANGLSVLSGHLGVGETPADAVPTAQPGDFFIDLSSPEYTMYGPMVKATPSSPPDWSNTKSLIGPAGTTIHHGDGTPPNNVGNIDDYWLDLSGYYLYGPKTASDTWVGAQVKLLIGADGAPGADALWNWTGEYNNGAEYNIGDLVYHPASGSSYYRSGNPLNQGYAPPDPASWTLIARKGDDGAAGDDGNTILTFDVDPTTPGDDNVGADGDYWLNKSTYVLYGPKAGVWPTTGHALTGAAGDAGSQIVAGDETPGQAGSPVSDALLAGDYYIRLNPSPATLYGPKPSDISWSGAPAVQIEGTKGDPGDPGTKIHSDSGDPVPSPTYAPGDFFINTTDKRLWGPADSSGNFVSYIDLTGQTGPQGPRGSAILSGDRTPVDGVDGSLGVDGVTGDFWINTTDPAALVLYGPKTSLGAWGSGRQLNGQNGVNGTDGKSIIAAASAPTGGKVGDLFLDTSVTGAPVLYGPKTSLGAWPYIADLKGDKGDKGDFGGAVFEYTLTASNPPGAAEARFNSPLSLLSNATELFIYNTDGNSANIAPYLGLIDDSTSFIKGTMKVEKQADQTVFAYFSIKDVTIASGASGVSTVGAGNKLEYLTGNGTFAAGDAVYISFMRTGDKGDPGTGGVVAVRGAYHSETTQTANTSGGVPVGTPMTFPVGDLAAQDVSIDLTNSKLIVPEDGTYNVQFSAQLQHTSGGGETLSNIWFRVNGTDVPNSDTKVTIPASGSYVVAAWNIMLDLVANDEVQIMWKPSVVDVVLQAEAATATTPAIPSVIVTIDRLAYSGKSTYELWKENGNSGDLSVFLNAQRGPGIWTYSTNGSAPTSTNPITTLGHNAGDYVIDSSSTNKAMWGPFSPPNTWPGPVDLVGTDGTNTSAPKSWFYGDGSDGNFNVTLAMSPYSLTGSMQYNNLTLDDGASINTNGHLLMVAGTLTMGVGSKIHRDGSTATGITGGTAASAGLYGSSASGGSGSTGGSGTIGGAATFSIGGSGGAGGGTVTTGGIFGTPAPLGGSAGLATGLDASYGGNIAKSSIIALTSGHSNIAPAGTFTISKLRGGAGGGGGGAARNASPATHTGGGGGGGGGVCVVIAAYVSVPSGTATISANGGNGANGSASNDSWAGGGGGGGGGYAALITRSNPNSADPTATGSVTISANGGTAGASGGGVTPASPIAATNGSAGTTRLFIWS